MPAISEQSRKRAANRYAILRTLHLTERQQRVVLSRQLGIRKSSVTSITAECVSQGILVEDAPTSLRTTLSLNATQNGVVVARLGLGEIETACVLLNGEIESKQSRPFEADASPARILDVAQAGLLAQLQSTERRVLGAGFVDMGIVDPVTGRTRLAVNLPRWRDVPVRAELEQRLGLGVHVDSDVRSQLWSAAWFGRHLMDAPTMLYIGILEGVAGAVMVNGQIVLGRNCTAGEFGHVCAGSEGRRCGCGKLDCLESYCSVGALVADVRRATPDLPAWSASRTLDEGVAVLERVALTDQRAIDVLRDAARRIARVVSPVLATLDPDALVFGGPGADVTRVLGTMVHEEVVRDLSGLGASGVRLILAGADHESTLRGIGGLVIDRCFQAGTPVLQPGFSSDRE